MSAYVFLVDDHTPTSSGSLADLEDNDRPAWWYGERDKLELAVRHRAAHEALGARLAAGEQGLERLGVVTLTAARLSFAGAGARHEAARELQV